VGLSLTSVSARDGQFEVLHSTFHLILYCTNQVDKLKIVFCFVFFLNKDIFQGRYCLGLDTLVKCVMIRSFFGIESSPLGILFLQMSEKSSEEEINTKMAFFFLAFPIASDDDGV
jgi:hypothetical protein